MERWLIRISCAFVAIVLGTWTGSDALAQGNSGGRGRAGAARSDSGGLEVDIDIVFGSAEVRLIREWFGDSSNLAGLPPGLAKRESLPPGLQRQLRKNGTLPPGLQSRVYRLPDDLERRLPAKREGLSRIVLGGNIILWEESTSVIVDIVALF
jgi:hypothetical protein